MSETHLSILFALIFAFGCDPASLEDAGSVDASNLDAGVEDASSSRDGGLPPDGPPATSSGGSGALPCQQTGSVDGLNYCVATVAGIQLKIIEPEPGEGPMDLALYLHGDGARAYEGDTALRIQAPWARARRTLYVAARAPNTCAWWLSPAYDCAGTTQPLDTEGENADALVAVIEALQNGWDLNYEGLRFGGSSGGAVFLTGSFLPLYGDVFEGAYALGCGGFAPYVDFAWEPTRENRGSTLLYFNYGDADEFIEEIEAGVSAYDELGFRLDVNVLEGGIAHCAFDHIGWVTEAWTQFNEQF